MTPLPINHAKHVAREWTEKQEDLPEGWYILARRYDQGRRGRYFTVQLSIKFNGHNNSREFGLITFLVKDDRSIEVDRDRRVYVRTLLEDLNHEIGRPSRKSSPQYTQEEAEVHLLDVMGTHKNILPKWHGRMRRGTDSDRQNQADLWCDIEDLHGKKTTVPVKVFVSRASKSKFFSTLPVTITRHYACIMVISGQPEVDLVQETVKRLNILRTGRLC